MPDEKKPLDPVLDRIIDAIAGMPEEVEEIDVSALPWRKRRGKEPTLVIRWHDAKKLKGRL